MSTKFEDVKQAIIEAQLASIPRNEIINEITSGMANFLSADDIIKCLDITPDEFQNLVNLPNHYLKTTGSPLVATLYHKNRFFDSSLELVNESLESKATFPKPDFYLLGKARWKKETFNQWIEEQCQ